MGGNALKKRQANFIVTLTQFSSYIWEIQKFTLKLFIAES